MNHKIYKIILLIVLFLVLLTLTSNATYVSNDPNVKSEGNISITVSSDTAIENYDIKLTGYDGLTYTGCSSSNSSAIVNSSQGLITFASTNPVSTLGTFEFKAPNVSSKTTYTVSFDIDGITNYSTVTVEPEETSTQTEPQTPAEEPTTQEEHREETETKEPKFTDTSKTVYATDDINLRESWSTSSQATQIKKDTELLLTGTSTETINGYVWYRVTYEGKVRYVASSLITETKPDSILNLKKLEIEGVKLDKDFDPSVIEYTARITNYESKEIKVTAEPENSKTTVKIEGNKNIVIGDNTIKITLTAEDGKTKVYTVKLKNEKSDAFGLKTLKINGKAFKGFTVDKYEYDYEFSDLDKLEIEAIANQEDATVKILGNENLKDGKNVINIVVKSKDGKTTVTYKINAKKIIPVQKEEKIDLKTIVICGVTIGIALIAIIVLIILYIRGKKTPVIDYGYDKDNLEEEDGYIVNKKVNKKKNTYDDYDEDDEEEQEQDEYKDEDDEYVEDDEYDEYDNNEDEENYEFESDEVNADNVEENPEQETHIDDIEIEEESNISRRKIKPEYTVDDLFNHEFNINELPPKKDSNSKGRHSK